MKYLNKTLNKKLTTFTSILIESTFSNNHPENLIKSPETEILETSEQRRQFLGSQSSLNEIKFGITRPFRGQSEIQCLRTASPRKDSWKLVQKEREPVSEARTGRRRKTKRRTSERGG